MIRILIADDHAVVRSGVKQILEAEEDMKVTGEASNGQELFSLLRKRKWDVLILDIGMPGGDGAHLLKKIHSSFPRLPVLILTIYPEDQFGLVCMKSGASGYLTKESVAEELVGAVRKVVGGGTYMGSVLANVVATHLRPGAKRLPHETLSDREQQVLFRIIRGEKLLHIAKDLKVNVKTVGTYRRRILMKMNLKTNADLIYYSIRHHLSP